jgi:hypothetical protein
MPTVQWQKGQSGNPAGRKPMRSINDVVTAKLRKRWAEFADSLLDVACKAEDYALRMQAARLVLQYTKIAPRTAGAPKNKPAQIEVEEHDSQQDSNPEVAPRTGTGD